MIDVRQSITLPEIETRKRESLQELIEDNEIRTFLTSHRLTYEVYSDYWSELLDFHEDYQICQSCSSLADCPKVTRGLRKNLVYDGRDIVNRLGYCDFGKDKEQESQVLSHVLFNNVSSSLALTNLFTLPIVKHASHLSAKNQKALSAVLSYLDQPAAKGLYISGEMGSDHTLLLAGLMNALAKKGMDVGICHFPTFLLDMKASFNSYQDDSYMNQILTIPYLMIDGIGEENITSWSRDEVLLTILSYRAINELPTFISSMIASKDLPVVYMQRRNDALEKMKAKTVASKIAGLTQAYTIDSLE